MRLAYTYDDYMKGKAACEDVISWADFFGRWLFQKKEYPETVLTILLGESYVDFYHFVVSPSGELHLEGWKNNYPNALWESLELGMYADSVVRQWWNQVFYQDDKGIHYERYYDEFRIAETGFHTFSQLLHGIKVALTKIPIPKEGHIYLPKSIVEHKPLLYVLQSEYNVRVSVIPDLSVDSPFNESCSSFENKSQFVLNAGGGIPIEALFNHFLTIQVPNETGTLESEAFPSVTWGRIVSGNCNRYYSGGVEFIEVVVKTESDLFGNVFLDVFEFDKKVKCIKIS